VFDADSSLTKEKVQFAQPPASSAGISSRAILPYLFAGSRQAGMFS